ncbi:DUF3800 domain-containing protein [Corynebacterium gerontici]|uniref:DUF3800 domain-containing protein n=1 Tax=Corynebacterium gerontici TaxID=2079234 RepID=UPI000F4DBE09|nr:DUF3800 domain-containing protein [Corynebacterium gerontici]
MFVDESGDFGPFAPHSPYYILGLVLHDQGESIESELQQIHYVLEQHGWSGCHSIHTAPLIRRESDYRFVDKKERWALFSALATFTRNSEILWNSFLVEKSRNGSADQIYRELNNRVEDWLGEIGEYLRQFGRIIVYYDGGQAEISALLQAIFEKMPIETQFRKVKPADYSLFQSADLLCTLTLLAEKVSRNHLSKSEEDFFRTPKFPAHRNLRKNFLKLLKQKQRW